MKIVDHQHYAKLKQKCHQLKNLIEQVYPLLDSECKKLVDERTSNWLAFGVRRDLPLTDAAQQDLQASAPQILNQYSMVGEYQRLENDYLRGKDLIFSVFHRHPSLSAVRLMICQSPPYAPNGS